MNKKVFLRNFGLNFRRPWLACAATAIAAAAMTQGAMASTLGLNFVNGGDHVQNGNANSLLTNDVAGASTYAQPYWNNLGRYGDNVNLVDSTGANSGVLVAWDATGTYGQNGGTPTTQGSPDANMMVAYLDSNGTANTTLGASIFANSANNKPLVFMNGLRAWLSSQGANAYDVVIYSDGDATAARSGEYWIVAATGDASNGGNTLTYGSDVTTHTFICDRANFIATSTFAPVMPEIQSGFLSQFGNFPGNYAVFQSLTNDSILLRTSEFLTRSPFNAIQIIARATPIPATIGPLKSSRVYAGGTARIRAQVSGVTPFTYRWQKGGVDLVDGGNITGTTNATLVLTNVTMGDAGTYSLLVTNPNGVATSSPATITVVTPAANSYSELVASDKPVAYWRLNDAVDPSTNYATAYDVYGGNNGTYGNAALNAYSGILGLQPPEFPGFEAGNGALSSSSTGIRTWMLGPSLNLNTNTASFTAWIYPTAAQAGFTALIFSRNGGDTSGFGYGNNNNLGYTWNNQAATYNFVSGLVPPTNQWSFVALVVSQSNAVIYLYSTNGQFSAMNPVTNAVVGFTGPVMIGVDPSSAPTPQGRSFNGNIDEVSVFNYSLSPLQVLDLYKKGLGLTAIAPVITLPPLPLALYEGRAAAFNVTASGDAPLTYQWQRDGTNLLNGGAISGATTTNLKLSTTTAADTATYSVVVGNAVGMLTSSPVALTIVASNSLVTPYEAALRTANPAHYWRLNELDGTFAYDYWGGDIATHTGVGLGAQGPIPPDFVGFESTNAAGFYDGFGAATSAGLPLVNNKPQFTIMGWFNSAGVQAARTGLFGQNDVVEFGFHGVDATGQAQLAVYTAGGGTAAFNGLGQTMITPGTWYLVAAVGDGSKVTLFLLGPSGVLQTSTSVTTTNYGSSVFPFNIGGGGILDATGNYFNGAIDEVATFDRALSVGELSTLYGAALTGGALPPGITLQPAASSTLYAGQNLQLTAAAIGSSPLGYQWRKNGVAFGDGANVTGTTNGTLVFTNLTAANGGMYDLVVTNSAGSATSIVATVTVITPLPNSYESAVVAAKPIAYYRLNSTNDPAAGNVPAFDYYGGHNGVYGVGARDAANGIFGPQPPYYMFETGNGAVATAQAVPNASVSAPFGSLSTNTVTMTMWIDPTGTFDTFAGLLVNRNAGVAGGFGYAGGQLGYTWNNNSAATYNFRSGLIPPLNQWTFVALVVEPTQATVYMSSPMGLLSATNVLAHTSDVFGNNWQIGNDNSDNANSNARGFTGQIDEVAVFNYSMTPSQIAALYSAGGPLPTNLSIQKAGSSVVLTWPQGTLLEAPTLDGPWTTNSATSPYTNTPSGAQKYYRTQIR